MSTEKTFLPRRNSHARKKKLRVRERGKYNNPHINELHQTLNVCKTQLHYKEIRLLDNFTNAIHREEIISSHIAGS